MMVGCFQGPGSISKYGNLSKKREKITKKSAKIGWWWLWCWVVFRVQGLFPNMVINKKIARELPKSEKKLQMVITVDDDVGVLVQGLGQHPKRKLLCWWWKNKQNIRKKPEKHINGVRDVRHYLQGLLQGLPQKGKLTWFDQKVKKNKMRMILPVRVHLMGCWDGGHMTNYQKWSKNISCSPLL